MLMAIDVGNTQIVVGLFADDGQVGSGDLLHHWRVATHRMYTADEFALQLSQLLALDGLELSSITGASVACVVPPLQIALREMTSRRLSVPSVFVEPGVRTGMPVLVDNERELGADRIADAVAAFERYGGPTIVVDLGTATNFEVVSQRGEYLGGVLFPGVEVSLNALSAQAALLPRVDIAPPRSVLGKNTVEQLQAGIFYGFGALVEGVCAKLEAEVGPATVVATGGLAGVLLGSTSVVDHYEPWLTLYGLRTIYHRALSGE
ncbi:MAG TPA: type III pantothenate kinase [Acidimicrobiales bacterium]|nr:type III pantothenate kinase [Acidimicrobiales bacterium]